MEVRIVSGILGEFDTGKRGSMFLLTLHKKGIEDSFSMYISKLSLIGPATSYSDLNIRSVRLIFHTEVWSIDVVTASHVGGKLADERWLFKARDTVKI